ESSRLFVRFHRDFWEEDKNRNFGNDVNGIILNRINRGLALDEVHMFSPGFLFNFRYGLSQQEFPQRRVSRGFDLASLGFSSNLLGLSDKALAAIPRISAGSLTALSQWEGDGDGTTASISHNLVGAFTWLKGDHNVRFGADYLVFREFRNRFPADISPDFSFSSLWGRGPLDNSTAPPVGAEIVSLLAGIPNGSMNRSGSYAEQDLYLGLYVQDDFKITRKLVLNLGLRVEREWPITERFNRSVTQFDAASANPIEPKAIANYTANPMPELPVSQFKVKGGVTFAGGGGNPRAYWSGQALLWTPRLGLAYQWTPKTVVRAGYGSFAGTLGILRTNSILAGFTKSTPMEPSPDNGLTWIATLQDPFPKGLLAAAGAAGGLETTLGQGTSFFAKNRKLPYAQRWSFGLQHQLPAGHMLEASYVGNRSTRVGVTRSLSFTPGQDYSTLPYRDQKTIDYLTANFRSPYYGLNPQFTSSTISREALLRQYPHFSNVQYEDEVGYSWYHSLQTRMEKRFSKGYTLQISYTWSKAMEATSFMNSFDAMPYESLAGIDRRHRLTGSGIWELPFGKGRRFGANWHPASNFFAGGWQLGGVYQRQSGEPIGWGQVLFTGDSSKVVLPSDQRNTDRWFNTDLFNRNSREQLDRNVRTFPYRFSNIRFDSQ
ncbi:MAG: TonB-dependent receptor, partial [Acidobacteriota bacterium]